MKRAHKPVIDVSCGPRQFWFDRQDDRAIFMDNRTESCTWNRANGKQRSLQVRPDVVGDFTCMPFADSSFHLIIFDPPHRKDLTAGAWQAATYGKLPKNWEHVLRAGFAECFRILKPNGTLIFKWNEHKIAVSKVLALTPKKPLIGQRCGKSAKTHWLVFIKGGRK